MVHAPALARVLVFSSSREKHVVHVFLVRVQSRVVSSKAGATDCQLSMVLGARADEGGDMSHQWQTRGYQQE